MKTLIWKEWREQRLFFFLAVGIIILSRVAPIVFPKGMIHYDEYAGVLSHFILPTLFSLFLGAISFTNEFTRNTKSFLSSQPVTSAKIFWTKFLSGLIFLLFLVLLAHLVFGVPLGNPFHVGGEEEHWPIFSLLIFLITLYSATCLSSLLLKNSLPAITCTPFILLFGILLVLPLAVVLFLISPSLIMFNFFVFSVLIATFLVFCFLTWQKAIVKDVSPVRVIFTTLGVVFIFSFGTHVIANLVAGRTLNKTIQQAKAAGIKLTLEEVIPPLVPDKDNAALIYQQAFDLAEKLPAKYKKEWEYMPYESKIPLEKLTPMQKSTIGRIIRGPDFAEFYGLVEKAVSLPACRFDIKYEDGSSILLPHLGKMRNIARLVAVRTYILTDEKRYHEALKSARIGLGLGDSLTNEPILISQLARNAVDVEATNSSRSLLSTSGVAISVEEYQKMISEIDRKDKRLTKGIEGEPIVFTGYHMESLFLNGGRRNPTGTRNFLKTYITYVLMPMFKLESAFYMRGIIKSIDFSNQPYFSIKSADAWEREITSTPIPKLNPKYILARMMLPTFGGAPQSQARYAATLESFKLALALKIYKQKHGNYPDKIASLSPEVIPELPLDPFTGKDYIYHKEGRGFILYSVGLNEKDDNGIYDQKQSQKFDDIAWKVLN